MLIPVIATFLTRSPRTQCTGPTPVVESSNGLCSVSLGAPSSLQAKSDCPVHRMPAPLPSAFSKENVPARPLSAHTDPCPEKADSPAGGYSLSQNPAWTSSRRLGSIEP